MRPAYMRLLLAAFAMIWTAQPAAAKWWRAESPDFVVYSNGDKEVLKAYVLDLERFDRTLRYLHNRPLEEPPARKLDIYLVRSNADLLVAAPQMGSQVAGYYHAGVGDIYAVAVRASHDNSTLQHEYTHHFMMQNFPGGYPPWLIEGYAEFYMTATFNGDTVDVGNFGPRAFELLAQPWLPLEKLLTKGPFEAGGNVSLYYAEGWVLTHYMMSDPQRLTQLQAYLRDVGRGADPAKAMEAATGLSLNALQRKLDAYIHGPIAYRRLNLPKVAAPAVSVSEMPASADDLLLLHQRLLESVRKEDQLALLAKVRTLAGRYPDDRLAVLTLARAESTLGDRAVADTLLSGWSAKFPADVEALQLLAEVRVAVGDDDPEQRQALYRQAGALLARAYRADPDNYKTIYAYVETRRVEPGFPSDTSLTSLLQAHALAPQVGEISLNTANLLMARGRYAEAVILLKPLANDPHGGGQAAAARPLLEEASHHLAAAAQAPPAN